MTRPEELDARGRRLRGALAAVLVPDNAPELRLMHEWLDNWSGLGLIIAAMRRRGFRVRPGEHGAGQWIAGGPPLITKTAYSLRASGSRSVDMRW